MFSVAADGKLLTPEDNDKLRAEAAEVFRIGDATGALRIIRYRLDGPPSSVWQHVRRPNPFLPSSL